MRELKAPIGWSWGEAGAYSVEYVCSSDGGRMRPDRWETSKERFGEEEKDPYQHSKSQHSYTASNEELPELRNDVANISSRTAISKTISTESQKTGLSKQ